LDIVKYSKLTEKKEVISYLKTEHSLGHFQSQKVFEVFKNVDEYASPENFIDQLFKNQTQKELFTQLSKIILDLGENVKMQPCKTYIPFYAKNQFIALSPAKSGGITISLKSAESDIPLGYDTTKPSGSSALKSAIIITDEKQINKKLTAIFLNAYKLAT